MVETTKRGTADHSACTRFGEGIANSAGMPPGIWWAFFPPSGRAEAGAVLRRKYI